MDGLFVFRIVAASIALVRCSTIALPVSNFETLYTWSIPPNHPVGQPSLQQPLQIGPNSNEQDHPPTGCGHPIFTRRQSHGQITLPNTFLLTPDDSQKPPVFLQLDPEQQQVNCNDATSSHPDRNCIQPSTPSTQPYNYFPASGQTTIRSDHPLLSSLSLNLPFAHSGGVGLLFVVPESASHLSGEQLILQHLGINNHRTQMLPIDISANCGNNAGDGNGCVSWNPAEAGVKVPTTRTNYANAPPASNVNSSIGQQRSERRTIGDQQQQQQSD